MRVGGDGGGRGGSRGRGGGEKGATAVETAARRDRPRGAGGKGGGARGKEGGSRREKEEGGGRRIGVFGYPLTGDRFSFSYPTPLFIFSRFRIPFKGAKEQRCRRRQRSKGVTPPKAAKK